MLKKRSVGLLLLIAAIAAPIYSGVVVSSFRASAGTNAFAPLDRSAYFDEQIVENVSPAVADASGDWTGTNYGGSTETWHWIGQAHSELSFSASESSLHMLGKGSFFREMTTTPDFVSPSNSVLLYGPASGGRVFAAFSLDTPCAFALRVVLSTDAGVSLYSFGQGAAIYSKINNNTQPSIVDVAGMLLPGEYTVGAGVGLGGAPDHGVSSEIYTGSFTDFLFTVQVPEPSCIAFGGVMGAMAFRRRR